VALNGGYVPLAASTLTVSLWTNFHERYIQVGRWPDWEYPGPRRSTRPANIPNPSLPSAGSDSPISIPWAPICHAPPYGAALDRVREGLHAGSRPVAAFLHERQPAWFFCGRIHEAEGVGTTIGRTRARNAGKRGYLLELD